MTFYISSALQLDKDYVVLQLYIAKFKNLTKCNQSLLNLTKPNQTKSNQTESNLTQSNLT